MFLLKTGTWFTHLSLEWIECPVGSRSITRSLHTSISAYCFGDSGKIYLRWKWDQSSLSVSGRGFCGISQSVSCHVSLKDTFAKETLIMYYFDFHFSHSLLDQKINNILSVSHDQVVLNSVQNIIQNMLASEDPSQQQLHFLQSCGFGGLWRFAGPFTKYNVMGESSELFVNCLEAMVETCLPGDEQQAPLVPLVRPYNLSSSLSSLTLGSPTDKG